eukprot:604014-Rhodomonas_salina.2
MAREGMCEVLNCSIGRVPVILASTAEECHSFMPRVVQFIPTLTHLKAQKTGLMQVPASIAEAWFSRLFCVDSPVWCRECLGVWGAEIACARVQAVGKEARAAFADWFAGWQVSSASGLRECYAMPGSHVAYGSIRWTRRSWIWYALPQYP